MSQEHPIKVGEFEGFGWIRCEGKGSFLNSPAMKEFGDGCIRSGVTCLVIDLEKCKGMDSTFMGTMFGMASYISKINGRVQVTAADENNQSALEDLGLNYLLDINPDEAVWKGLEDKVRDFLYEKKAGLKAGTEVHSRHVLEAHEVLSKANDANREKFAGVVSTLGNQLGKITLQTSMKILMEEMPGARRALFAKYHLGGCQSCAFDDSETLAELCLRSEIDPTEVLSHLLASHKHDEKMLLSPEAVKAKIDAGEQVHWIDVRTREEHEAVKIEGSEFFTQDLQAKIFSEKSGGIIVLYDHLGKYVLDQVAWFRGHQLENTYGLTGGLDAWSQQVDKSIMRYRLEM